MASLSSQYLDLSLLPSSLKIFVLIQVKEVTALAGRDFLVSPSSLIQFDPGMCSPMMLVDEPMKI